MIDPLRESIRQVLSEQKTAMRAIVDGLSDEGLNWLPGGNDETNSIAQMLSHALEAERFLAATSIDATVDRSREAQFQIENVSATDVLVTIDQSEQIVNGFLDQLTAEHLGQEVSRGTALGSRSHNGSWWLLHAIEHSNEHIGQASLTRQLFEGRSV